MSIKSFPIYPSLNLAQLSITQRDYLYLLEPIGMGTPYVESLRSYVYRLSHKNCVSPSGLLYALFILSNITINYFNSSHQILNINGSDGITLRVVESLEFITSLNNLSSLTMLSFFQILQTKNMFRYYRAWCPICYHLWYQNKSAFYEPLLWQFFPLEFCPIHNCLLIDRCFYCHKQTSTRYLAKLQLGFCPHCSQCLGQTLANIQFIDIIWNRAKILYQKFVANNLCQVISLFPVAKTCPLSSRFAQYFHDFIDLKGVKIDKFNDLVKNYSINPIILFWIYRVINEEIPHRLQLQELLDLAYYFNRSINHLLYEDIS